MLQDIEDLLLLALLSQHGAGDGKRTNGYGGNALVLGMSHNATDLVGVMKLHRSHLGGVAGFEGVGLSKDAKSSMIEEPSDDGSPFDKPVTYVSTYTQIHD